jgi:hypothetical protein
VNRGAHYFQIGWLADPTSRFAERRVMPPAGREAALVRDLVAAVAGRASDRIELVEMVEALRAARRPAFVLGMAIAGLPEADALLAAVDELVALTGGAVLVPHAYGNLPGLLEALRPRPCAEIEHLVRDARIDVLWLVGENPFDERPPVRTIIYQNTLPPPAGLAADVVLPVAAWCEVTGSLAAGDGGLPRRTVQAAVRPPGLARQEHEIFAIVAEAMGVWDVGAPSPEEAAAPAGDAWRAAAARLDGDRIAAAADPPGEIAGRTLVREPNPHRHRGVALSDCVEGFARLAPEDTLLVNPQDAAELGVGDGDALALTSGGPAYRVRLDRKVPSGLLYLLASPQNASSVRTGVR